MHVQADPAAQRGGDGELTEREPVHDRFWQFDRQLGEAVFFDEHYTVRMRAHLSEEPYRSRTDCALFPLSQAAGTRVYVLAKPYILLPRITLTVDLANPPTRPVLGEVTASDWQGMDHLDIGSAQAWYYPTDRTILLWECFLEHRFRDDDPTADAGLAGVWSEFEEFLVGCFPDAATLVTPPEEPLYEDETRWHDFLGARGYSRLGTSAFVKAIPR